MLTASQTLLRRGFIRKGDMNTLDSLIQKKFEKEIVKEVSLFLYSKEGASLIKRKIKDEVRAWLEDASIDDLLSQGGQNRLYKSIEDVICKRLGITERKR